MPSCAAGGRALFEIQPLLRVLDLREGIRARDLHRLLALPALHGLLLLVGEGDALVGRLVEVGQDLHAVREQHLHRASDEFAVLPQRAQLGADARRGDRQREVLRIAVEVGLHGAAQRHAGVDADRRVAVDRQFDFVARRRGALHDEHVGPFEMAFRRFGYLFRVDHIAVFRSCATMKEGDFPSPFRFASSFDNANIVKKSDIQIFIGKILTHGAPLCGGKNEM